MPKYRCKKEKPNAKFFEEKRRNSKTLKTNEEQEKRVAFAYDNKIRSKTFLIVITKVWTIRIIDVLNSFWLLSWAILARLFTFSREFFEKKNHRRFAHLTRFQRISKEKWMRDKKKQIVATRSHGNLKLIAIFMLLKNANEPQWCQFV